MRRRLVTCAALAALALPASAAAGIRINAVHVAPGGKVSATVVTSKPVTRAPSLREDGRVVGGVTAQNFGRDKSVVLAIDRSQSMRGKALDDASGAARAFVAAKAGTDRIAIVAVGVRALQLTRFTSATIDADGALRSIETDKRTGTALYDSVVLASEALAGEPTSGRVLILLTDGQEVSSKASLDEAVAAAKKANVVVYPVGIESAAFRPGPMRRLAAETGGRYHAASSTGELRSIYASIASELSRTWRLEYVTTAGGNPSRILRVSAPANGSAATTFAYAGSSGGAGGLLPDSVYRSTAGSLLVALVVAGLVLLAAFFLNAARRGSWLRGRLAPHVKTPEKKDVKKEERERLAAAAELFRVTERSFSHTRIWKGLELQIERANLRLRTVELVYICAGSALFFGLVGAVLGLPTMLLLGVFAGGLLAPYAFVVKKAKRRAAAFEEQLADLLLTIAASLKAGHSFKQGMQSVVDEGHPPTSDEFKRVLTEMQLGRPMDEALEDCATRVGSKNFAFVVTAVTIQRQVGGSLAGLFDMVAETVRQRQQFQRKVQALTAMGRASAWTLIGLPFMLAAAITVLNREYMRPLWFTSTGHVLIMIALVGITIGSLILRKIVTIKG